MSVSDTKGDSVYLGAYDDYEHHTLKLTAHRHTVIEHHARRLRNADLAVAGDHNQVISFGIPQEQSQKP